jgi:hypothetical protein
MILVRSLDLKFLHELAARLIRNFKSTALALATVRARRSPRDTAGPVA